MIRHGETEDNKAQVFSRYETILSEKGKREIEAAREKIKDYDFDQVYYSPLIRTEESLKHLGLEGIPEKRIREYDFGVFAGLTAKEIEEKFPEDYREWMSNPEDFVVEGGESLSIVYKRVVEFLEELVEKDEDVLLVAHGGVIRLAFCWVFDNIDYFLRFKVDNGSINIISIDDGFKFIKKSNLRPRLK